MHVYKEGYHKTYWADSFKFCFYCTINVLEYKETGIEEGKCLYKN